MFSFDLVRRPWIPVTAGGTTVELVSLCDALTRAHEIDALSWEDSLQTVAVLRQVLLPVLLDACGAPRSEREWARRWDAGRLDAGRLSDYLDEHADRFDLFHLAAPFAQVADLRTANEETKPVSLLMPAVATGNNTPLFTSRTDADPPLLPAATAARALLAAHCWDTGGIKPGAIGDPQAKGGKVYPPKGASGTGPLGGLGVVIPAGPTLAATLLLNTPILRQGMHPQDRPQWRAPVATAGWQTRAALGLLDLLTFQSRRIRLIPQLGPDGQPAVSRVVMTAGDRLDHIPDSEPHTLWRQVKKPGAGAPPQQPARHQAGRVGWRGLTALLATTAPTADGLSTSLLVGQAAGLQAENYLADTLALQVMTVGVVYGNQSAVVEDVLTDTVPLPVLALAADTVVRDLLQQVVDQAERLRRAGNTLGDDLRLAAGGDKLPSDKGQRLGDALVFQLTPAAHRLLAGLQREPDRVDDADDAWQQVARTFALNAGEQALATAPPQAFLGRQVRRSPTDARPVAKRLADAEAHYRAAIHLTLPRRPSPARSGAPT